MMIPEEKQKNLKRFQFILRATWTSAQKSKIILPTVNETLTKTERKKNIRGKETFTNYKNHLEEPLFSGKLGVSDGCVSHLELKLCNQTLIIYTCTYPPAPPGNEEMMKDGAEPEHKESENREWSRSKNRKKRISTGSICSAAMLHSWA